MRIVRPLPSGTELVCALGLRDALVGVSHECDHPSSVHELPRVTSGFLDHGHLLEWPDPPWSAGHWVPEQVAVAGGRELFGVAGAPSLRVPPDDVLAADPDWVFGIGCGFGLAEDLEHLRALFGRRAAGRSPARPASGSAAGSWATTSAARASSSMGRARSSPTWSRRSDNPPRHG